MPEFLTEKNWKDDFFTTSLWIFGGTDDRFKRLMTQMIYIAYGNEKIKTVDIVFLSTDEAEAIKYFRNSFLATKVAFCNEFYTFCRVKGIDYTTVAKYACADSRIGSSHTTVPGHDGKYGFGGTCLPKDTVSLRNQMGKLGLDAPVLSAVVERNNTIDRPEQDWKGDVGRAYIFTNSDTPSILVTGGAGFIGNNLCRYLLNKGERVIVVDNFCSSNREYVKELLTNSSFTMIEADILDKKKYCHLRNIKSIYHLACAASPPKYQADPIHTMETCFTGTRNILDLARENKCPVLFTSTSEVYGEPMISPQPETYRGNVNTVGIRSCYDEGKRIAETLCFEYRRLGIDTKIVRIFNTFGPFLNPEDGRVVTNFIKQAVSGQDITIYGTGSQTRSFCYVDDLVEGLVKMMASAEHGPINLGNPNEISVLEIAEKIIKVTGSSSKLVFCPLPQDDPTQRCPDISVAIDKLGWKPVIDLDTGLQKTIKWNQEQR
jgi:UDP-glucuronate decarboxylase